MNNLQFAPLKRNGGELQILWPTNFIGWQQFTNHWRERSKAEHTCGCSPAYIKPASPSSLSQNSCKTMSEEFSAPICAPDGEAQVYDVEMHRVSEEFARCYQAAHRHIDIQAQGRLFSWLRVSLYPPFLEHLSFRLGNQLLFIRFEDVEGQLEVPGSRKGLQAIAEGCKGHACLMPMRRRGGTWAPDASGWRFLDAQTGVPIDPVALITDERIEMTDWELHDAAVQAVRDELQKDGKRLMSWTGDPRLDPAIWFVGDAGPEWIVVRAARYPAPTENPPAHWKQIAERSAKLGKEGTFLSLSVASSPDAFDPGGAVLPEPLWRGHKMFVRFEELVTWPAGSAMSAAIRSALRWP